MPRALAIRSIMVFFSSTEPVSIAFISRIAENPYFNSLIGGFSAACKTLGNPFTAEAPDTADPRAQLPLVAAQIERKVNVIAITPNSPTALNELFDKARRQNILVLAINSDLPGHEDRRDAVILPVDFSKVGAAQIELLG